MNWASARRTATCHSNGGNTMAEISGQDQREDVGRREEGESHTHYHPGLIAPSLHVSSPFRFVIILLPSLAHIGEKEDFGLSKKTTLRAVFAVSNDRAVYAK